MKRRELRWGWSTWIGLGFALFMGIVAFGLTINYWTPFHLRGEFVASDASNNLMDSRELANFPIMAQTTEYTCNVVSMAIVMDYLGVPATEQTIRNELGVLDRTKGMLPNEYLDFAIQAFAPLNVTVALENPASQAEILNTISQSLAREMPVVLFYSTINDWNKPNYDTHYAVVYGIDWQHQIVTISNPYGYSEELTFADLFAGLDFSNYAAEPFTFRLARATGLVHKNSLFIFDYNNTDGSLPS